MSLIKILAVFLVISSKIFANVDWAEEKLATLSSAEKIGQLFIVPACPLRGDDHLQDLYRLIDEYKIGGLIPKQATPSGQVALLKKLKARSSLPLLCLQDAEYGLAMRLNPAVRYPQHLTLGAIQDDTWLFKLGQRIGADCKKVGAHINLAPVVDVNTNPQNPIIHKRSFGQDPIRVAKKGEAYMRGLQAAGILACAKHFPGHGDTSVDSHLGLPSISHDLKRLRSVELYSFAKMIEAGVDAVMTAHLMVPAYDNLPATLSKKIVHGLLKEEMGFKGLVITDALNMKALALHYSPEEIALNAFRAGSDLLLYGDHIDPQVDTILRDEVPRAIAALKEALHTGLITEAELDARVLKILKVKELLPSTLEDDPQIIDAEALALKRELFRQAVTLVHNENELLPLTSDQKIAFVPIGESKTFYAALSHRASVETSPSELSRFDLAIVALYKDATPEIAADIAAIKIPVCLVLFSSPYNLSRLPGTAALIAAYEDDPDAEEAAADVIFGLLEPMGILPIMLYTNELKSWSFDHVGLPPIFRSHLRLAYGQWSLAPNERLEEPPLCITK